MRYLRELQDRPKGIESSPQENRLSYYNSVEEDDFIPQGKINESRIKFDSSHLYRTFDGEVLEELRRAVLLHQNILRMSAMLEHYFYPFMLGKIFVCSLLACFLAYLSSSGLGSIMKVITLLEYLILVFAELLLNTYFPSILLQQVRNFKELNISISKKLQLVHFILFYLF